MQMLNADPVQSELSLIEKLREADKRKNEFLALLAHELRNPLAAISNSSALLSYTGSGRETVKNVQAIINRQVTQITRLVDDILDITRITENKIQLALQEIDINELVLRVVDDNRFIFARAGLFLVESLAESPILVHGDALRLTQVINNLLQNAAKFANNGGKIQVFVEFNKQTNEAIVRVLDDGIGFEPSLAAQLFEPFRQVDNSFGGTQAGLGLGLALVKGLIELHHGSVQARSSGLGLGAEFIVTLPLFAHSEEQVLTKSEEVVRVISSRTILIIDDNEDVRESLNLLLLAQGHKVHLAADGLTGIAIAHKIKPDFILCDIGLPQLNGYQIATAFRDDPLLNRSYLIALSGYAQPEEIEKAQMAGFDLHLAKPFNFDLLQTIFVDCY